MNAIEARKKRGGLTLSKRIRKDPKRAARIDRLVAEATIEHTLQQIETRKGAAATDLSRSPWWG